MAGIAVCLHFNMKYTNYMCVSIPYTITLQHIYLWRTSHYSLLLPHLLILFITATNLAIFCHELRKYITVHNCSCHPLILFITLYHSWQNKHYIAKPRYSAIFVHFSGGNSKYCTIQNFYSQTFTSAEKGRHYRGLTVNPLQHRSLYNIIADGKMMVNFTLVRIWKAATLPF